jgi:uncharacterized protein (DUF3820 family)
MTYLKFPFGKHKGEFISDLPSTYIVHALETFDLPIELISRLKIELIKRLDLIEIAHIIREYEIEQAKSGENNDTDIWDLIS